MLMNISRKDVGGLKTAPPRPAGKLILVRHGKTVLNSLDDSEKLRGWLDVPLNDEGLEEAETTARQVAQYPVVAIYCSDLLRARQTAAAIARGTKLAVIATSELRPWNVGSLAGKQVSTILDELQQLELDPSRPAPDGESFLQFYDRYSQKLKGLLEIADRSSGCIVAVTHVRNLLAAPTILQGGDKTKIPVRGGAKTGALLWVQKSGGKWHAGSEEEMRQPLDGMQRAGSRLPAERTGSNKLQAL
jgi:2,3-bisphosphoglycerate-dependent phosphoglycerate mutase